MKANKTQIGKEQPSRKLSSLLHRLPLPNLLAWNARARWIKTARSAQITPKGSWRIWLILAGRGWGKTRTGAEDIASYVLWNEGVRVGVIAPTWADARDVCVEGESGLLSVLPASCIASWHRSTGDLALFNGSRIKIYSADQPDRLRGPQHHRVWCDELAAWPGREAFDQVFFGLRLGDDPRVVITTTPRPTALMRELVARDDVWTTRGSTFENERNLAPVVLDHLRAQYEGSRLGRQELEAEILEDAQGALWSHERLDALRVREVPALTRIVVAIDPAMSSHAQSDETGIVAAGRGEDGKYYVLADHSCRASPEGWASRAIQLYEECGAQMIVAEVNAGGEMVERILRQSAQDVPFKAVRALRGKFERAMPIAALYEQGRVHHVGVMRGLEDQMTNFAPGVIEAKSPDRVDALVWALSELSGRSPSEPRIRTI